MEKNTPRQIGLKDVHIALLVSDGPAGAVYAEPIKIGRAITAKITPNVTSEAVYSDDSMEDELKAPPVIDVEIEQSALTLQERAIILGKRYQNGELIENENDTPPKLALLFRSEKSNSTASVPVFRYCVYYKGMFSEIEDEFETKGEKVNPKSTKIKGKFYTREYDGNWRMMIDSDDPSAIKQKIESFFEEVPEPSVKEEE